jgi:hypothetical protein
MSGVVIDTRTGPVVNADGPGNQPLRQGRTAELVTVDGHSRYYEPVSRRSTFNARAVVTAPVIYTTSAGTGGPMLWNPPGSGVNAAIIGVSAAMTTSSTVATALGLTGGTNQLVAPTSTTAIDSASNNYIGGAASLCTTYRVGTPSAAGTFLIPLFVMGTGAITVDAAANKFLDYGGLLVIPPGCWASIAAAATASTAVLQIGLFWEEVPISV